jgi:hypothetical protein
VFYGRTVDSTLGTAMSDTRTHALRPALRSTLAVLAVLALAGPAAAQEGVLIFATQFEGEISPAVREQFREALRAGLAQESSLEVFSEPQSTQALGGDAQRIAECADDATCQAEASALTGASSGVALHISEAGEIYTFTLHLYRLAPPEALGTFETDCALCTVEEALAEVTELGATNASALVRSGGAVAAVEPEVIPDTTPEVVPDTTPEVDPEVDPDGAGAPEVIDESHYVALVVVVEPDDAEVFIDGQRIAAGDVRIELAPGSYSVRASADGYESARETLVLREDDEEVELSLRLDEVEEDDDEPPVAGARRSGGLADVDTTAWGSVLVGTGLVSLVTGVVLIAIDGDTTCSEGTVQDCPDVFDTGVGGTILTAAGSAALTTGIIFLLWESLAGEPVAEDSAARGLGVAWGLGHAQEGPGLLFSGSF